MKANKVKRVIILTNTLKNGGAEKQSIMLAFALQKEYSTSLIVYYGDQFDDKLKKLAESYNIKIIWLKGSHFKKIIWMYSFFRKNEITAIFSYLATTNFLNAVIGYLSGVKYLIGGIRNAKLSTSKMVVQRFLHNHLLDYSIFNNHQGLKELGTMGFSVTKSVVIHNSIEIKLLPKIFFPPKERFTVISVGRFVAQKDYNTAIDTVSELATKLNDLSRKIAVEYIIVGYGELENRIREYISEKKLENYIQLIINPPNVYEYLAKGDVYLSTSLFEGLSNSIMEAMEHSLPIVATNVGDNDQLVQMGYNGFLTNVKDSKSLAEGLFKLLTNQELLETYSKNSYQQLVSNFSDIKFKEKYIHFIENTLLGIES